MLRDLIRATFLTGGLLALALTAQVIAHEAHENEEGTTDWTAAVEHYLDLCAASGSDEASVIIRKAKSLEAALEYEPAAFRGPLAEVRAALAELTKAEGGSASNRPYLDSLGGAFPRLVRERKPNAEPVPICSEVPPTPTGWVL